MISEDVKFKVRVFNVEGICYNPFVYLLIKEEMFPESMDHVERMSLI